MTAHAVARERSADLAEDRPRTTRWPALVAVLLGLLVASAGLGYGLASPPTWTAEHAVVVVPTGKSVSEQAALYETLSRGQVVATAAEIYSENRWHAAHPEVEVSAGAVPPSAVLQVTASGTNRAEVEAALAEVLTSATPEANRILKPYRVTVLDSRPPTARESGLSLFVWAGIAGLAGLLAGAFGYVGLAAIRDRWSGARFGRRMQDRP
ncbi:hypothetical protein [Microlunatus sp. GCM10028923]|uniref:hypothetical protein n=1 Tax=Microlunatus sp. GCM10028923 TaxID=3273400 RepID=UPI00361A4646